MVTGEFSIATIQTTNENLKQDCIDNYVIFERSFSKLNIDRTYVEEKYIIPSVLNLQQRADVVKSVQKEIHKISVQKYCEILDAYSLSLQKFSHVLEALQLAKSAIKQLPLPIEIVVDRDVCPFRIGDKVRSKIYAAWSPFSLNVGCCGVVIDVWCDKKHTDSAKYSNRVQVDFGFCRGEMNWNEVELLRK